MSAVIYYSTKYGATKAYATELSKKLNIEAYQFDSNKEINLEDTIIYMGSVYAGSIKGFSSFIKSLEVSKIKKIIIVSVGIAKIEDLEAQESIKAYIEKTIADGLKDKYHFFYLQGALDYNKLNFFHKIIMKAIYNSEKKKKNSKEKSEISQIMESEDKKISFIDFSKLDKIISSL